MRGIFSYCRDTEIRTRISRTRIVNTTVILYPVLLISIYVVTHNFLLKICSILTESVHLFCFIFHYRSYKTITGLALGSQPKLTRLTKFSAENFLFRLSILGRKCYPALSHLHSKSKTPHKNAGLNFYLWRCRESNSGANDCFKYFYKV